MRFRHAAVVFCLLAFTFPAVAQEQANLEELNRKYQDALSQLKAAQDRKNELATENDQLKARLAEVEKQLEQRARESIELAQRTYFLRSHYAAWESFIRRYPTLAAQWQVFFEDDPLNAPPVLPDFDDTELRVSSTRPATTQAGPDSGEHR